MMAATTSSTLASTSSSSTSGETISSNGQGSGTQKFGQKLAQIESNAPKREGQVAANDQGSSSQISKGLNSLVSEEALSGESALSDTEALALLSEQSVRETGVLPPGSQPLQTAQQKPLVDSQLSETTALKAQSAVSAVGTTEGKSQRASLNTLLSQRESVSTMASELFSRDKLQVAQDSKLSAVNDVAQVRTTSQELNFKAELAMNSSNKAEVGQRLVSMLSDKITLQASAQANKATIRLDPPELGKIDLTVTLDRDRLSVQINTTNASVREAINQTVERLRAELVQENFLEVTVNVSNDDKSGTSQHDNEQDDALTHIASNQSSSEIQAEDSSEQQQEIIARV